MPVTPGPHPTVGALFIRAQLALGLSQRALGESLGVSLRTVSRWTREGPNLREDQFHDLARRVFPRDAELAAQLARAGHESLESLGIVAPSPRSLAAVPLRALVDAVVCSAAEALGSSPGPMRSALLAALQRARQLGLDAATLERELAAPANAPSKEKGNTAPPPA
jgi:hypothetical protein